MDGDLAGHLMRRDLFARWKYEANHFELLRFHERRCDGLRDRFAQWADVDDLTGCGVRNGHSELLSGSGTLRNRDASSGEQQISRAVRQRTGRFR